MTSSRITRKGQVTIPKAVRDELGCEEGDRVAFVRRGDDIVLKVLRGSILDIAGTVAPRNRPEDFEAIRASVRSDRAERTARSD